MSILIELLWQPQEIITGIVLIAIGWYFGTRAQKRHLTSLKLTEAKYQHITVSSERMANPIGEPVFVTGNVVVAQDQFKLTVAIILSLFGKNLTVYEQLLERARREALVRAKAQADKAGCHAIYGLRFETSNIGNGMEVLAYGVGLLHHKD